MCRAGETRVAAEIGSRKARTLLAVLGLRCDQLVTVNVVADALWSDHPPRRPVAGVATLVSRLRARFGPETIVGAGAGYRLDDVVHTMRLGEDQAVRERAGAPAMRPEPPGGYIGLGSQIWGWLLLHRLGVTGGLHRAGALAGQVADGVRADGAFDLLHGMAGAVVPLLRLAEATDDTRWMALAGRIGDRLLRAATADGCWATTSYPEGIGGFAHGATGIAWALVRLAAVTGEAGHRRGADLAFAYEESLYDPALRGWRDLRSPGVVASAWCHGAGGIGVAAVDLLSHGEPHGLEVLRRAAAGCWESGMGWNHTLCHGDLGAWEVIDTALTAGVGPAGVDRAALDAHVLSSLEEYGPVSGLARETFSPGLLPDPGSIRP